MRHQRQLTVGPCLWTDDGAVWAGWRLARPGHGLLDQQEALALHERVRQLLCALPPTAQLLGVTRPVPHAELVQRVTDGVPPDARESWRRHAAPDVVELARGGIAQRRLYLFAQLQAPSPAGMLRAGLAALLGPAGRPAPPPDHHARRRALAAAAALQARLRPLLTLTPVGHEEVRWLHERTMYRGLPTRPGPRRSHAATSDRSMPRPRRLVATWDEVVVHEGGTSADRGRPRHRRYVRVDTAAGSAFQTTTLVAGLPASFVHPGGAEWLALAEALPFPVDWTVRLLAVPNGTARARARRQHRQLLAQVAEHEGEPAGPPPQLAAALAGAEAEQAALAENPTDPELEATLCFTTWARDLPALEDRATRLSDVLRARGADPHRPTGDQAALMAVGLPATPSPPVVRDYVQHLMPRDLAAAAPLVGSAVGEPQGIPVGTTVATGLPEPVLLDPGLGPATNRSGSLGICGALGSGKSHLVKRLVLGVVARGGTVVTLDRSGTGEYVRLAQAVDGRLPGVEAEVVTLDGTATIGLDPLRAFSGPDRGRVTLAVLCLLTRAAPTGPDGACLAEAVRHVAGGDGRLVDVVDVLEGMGDRPARTLARTLRPHLDHPLGHLLFGDHLPPGRGRGYRCFHAPGLRLPDRPAGGPRDDRSVLPEELLGQALLHSIAALARDMAFADPAMFGAVLVDEAWALTSTALGRAMLLDTIRDGRKHNAAAWVVSQHPDDLGDDVLTHLLGVRVAFAQPGGAAPAAARLLGLAPTPPITQLLTGLPVGTAVMRDLAGRVGTVRVAPSADPQVQALLDTRPSSASAAAGPARPTATVAELPRRDVA